MMKRTIDGDFRCGISKNYNDSASDSEQNCLAPQRSRKRRITSAVSGILQAGFEPSQLESPAQSFMPPKPGSRLVSSVEETTSPVAFPAYDSSKAVQPAVSCIHSSDIKSKPKSKTKLTAKHPERVLIERKITSFKDTTKPLFPGKSDSAPTPTFTRSSIVSRHAGFKTTENTVKMLSHTLSFSQTTMSKLDSFRYNPARPRAATSPVLVVQEGPPVLESPIQRPHPKEPPLFYEYMSLPSTDVVSHKTYRNRGLLPTDTFVKYGDRLQTQNNTPKHNQRELPYQTDLGLDEKTSNNDLSVSVSDFDKPVCQATANGVENIQDPEGILVPQMPTKLINDPGVLDVSQGRHDSQNYERSLEVSEGLNDPQIYRQESLSSHYSDAASIHVLSVEEGLCRLHQPYVESPNISMLSKELLHSEGDGFEDVLSDSDLFAISSENPMLDMELDTVSSPNDAQRLILLSISSPDPKAHKLSMISPNTRSLNSPGIQVSPQPLRSEWEDDYPMDEGDEEEMLKLPEPIANILPCRLLPNTRQSGSSEAFENADLLSPQAPSRPAGEPVCSSLLFRPYFHSQSSAVQRPGSRLDLFSDAEERIFHSADRTQIIELPNAEPPEDSDEARIFFDEKVNRPSPPRPLFKHPVRNSWSSHASASSETGDPNYSPLQPFARPEFPSLVQARSPVVGLLSHTFLRTCFKIGEMFKEGKRCSSLGQDAIVELFARVVFSSRKPGTKKQNFVFADLWRNNPPYPEGVLMNYEMTRLAEAESLAFVDLEGAKMARCLGRLKRDRRTSTGWSLHILTIRETDWEEIRYTKAVVGVGCIPSEGSLARK